MVQMMMLQAKLSPFCLCEVEMTSSSQKTGEKDGWKWQGMGDVDRNGQGREESEEYGSQNQEDRRHEKNMDWVSEEHMRMAGLDYGR